MTEYRTDHEAEVAKLRAALAEVKHDRGAERQARRQAQAERDEAREKVARLWTAIATHRQEQGEAVTRSAADAADRRLWSALAPATEQGTSES